MAVLGNIVFVLFLATGLVAALLGLPGTLIIAADVLVYGAVTGFERTPWWLILVLFLCAAAAETGDNVLSAWGVRRFEGSRRGMVGAIIGGLVGAFLGSFLGAFLAALGAALGPVGAVACFAIGPLLGGMALSYVGALLGERTTGKEWPEAAHAAAGAFVGRVLAVALKIAVAAIMVVLALVAVFSSG